MPIDSASRRVGTCVFAAFALAFLALPSTAQFSMRAPDTLFQGATVHTVSGEVLEGVDVLVSGTKIKAVGKDLAKTVKGRVRTVDARGKTIIPALIDASSSVGLDATAGARPGAAQDARDRIDLWDREPITDAIEQGVVYVHLRASAGARGVGMRLPRRSSESDAKTLVMAGSDVIHLKVTDSNGALASLTNVQRFERTLEGAKKYRESWEKYREELKKYVEALGKGKKPDAKKTTGTSKPGDKKPPRPRIPLPRRRAVDGSVCTDENCDHDHEIEVCTDENCDHDHEVCTDENCTHDHAHDEKKKKPTVEDPGETDYDLPTVVVGPFPKPCPVCGGKSHEENDHNADPFDFWQFEQRVLQQQPPRTPVRRGTTTTKGATKKPRKPRFDPNMEEMVKALEGKRRVRLEVHRAQDIVNVLKVLEKYPLDVVFEGVSEGWLVAKDLAKAGHPVVIRAAPQRPAQESGGGGGSSFPRFPRFPRFPGNFPAPGGGATSSGHQESPRNAAILHHAGVPVVIASSGAGRTATPHLLSSAAWAAAHGMPRDAALAAVTRNAARVLGADGKLGSIEAGRVASFVVLTGDVFDGASRVESVYIEGRKF